LCAKHPGILAEKREEFEVATTAIFWRFPNKNPENATFSKEGFIDNVPKPMTNTRLKFGKRGSRMETGIQLL